MAIESNKALMASVHSVRSRLKAPDHLEEKLARKIRKYKEEKSSFDINPDNLLVTINDLAGVRLLHLYTRQITSIDLALREVFKEGKYELLEGPKARTWDDESREF
jgi:putative GTP pyrophosphokinase